MVNKQLADWIKTEEAQGYTENQLRNYLKKQKYKQARQNLSNDDNLLH